MCVYLPTKCQVSSIILTSFRQGVGRWGGVILPLHLPPPQNEPLKSPFRLGLTSAENESESTSRKLKSSEYEFNMFSLVNVTANFNFGTHQIKSLVLIFVKMFHVTCLMQARKKS